MSCGQIEYAMIIIREYANDHNFKWSYNPFDGYFTIKSEEPLYECIKEDIKRLTNGLCRFEVVD